MRVLLIKVIKFIQILDKWAKIGLMIGIWLGNNQDNFQLYKFIRNKNIAKESRGLFLTHTVHVLLASYANSKTHATTCQRAHNLTFPTMSLPELCSHNVTTSAALL